MDIIKHYMKTIKSRVNIVLILYFNETFFFFFFVPSFTKRLVRFIILYENIKIISPLPPCLFITNIWFKKKKMKYNSISTANTKI